MNLLTTLEHDARPTDKSSFQYSSLDTHHIRLLQIASPPNSTQIACQIKHFLLNKEVRFKALSYQWGSAPSGCKIMLNGQSVEVRKNLWRFLRQVQDLDLLSEQWIWIDALCIDQANIEERTHQVSYMRTIFSQAERTIAWLGPAHDDSDTVFQYLTSPLQPWRNERTFARILHKPLGSAIARFCHRTYWTRLWIFQELVLAQDLVLMCGRKTMLWADFQAFSRCIDTCRTARLGDDFNFKHVLRSPTLVITRLINDFDNNQPLWGLVMGTKHLRCADPRDKVFALLGVAENGDTGIQADYSKSINIILNEVLRHQHDRCEPRSLDEVADQCWNLTALCYQADTTSDIFDVSQTKPLDSLAVNVPGSKINFWWALSYGHAAIGKLLKDCDIVTADNMKLALREATSSGNTSAISLLLMSTFGRHCPIHSVCSALKSIVEREVCSVFEKLFDHCLRSFAIPDVPIFLSQLLPEMVGCDRGRVLRSLLTRSGVTDALRPDSWIKMLRIALDAGSPDTVQLLLGHRPVQFHAMLVGPSVGKTYCPEANCELSPMAHSYVHSLSRLFSSHQVPRDHRCRDSQRQLGPMSVFEIACSNLLEAIAQLHERNIQIVSKKYNSSVAVARFWKSFAIFEALLGVDAITSAIPMDFRAILAFLAGIIGHKTMVLRLTSEHDAFTIRDDGASATFIHSLGKIMTDIQVGILMVFVYAEIVIILQHALGKDHFPIAHADLSWESDHATGTDNIVTPTKSINTVELQHRANRIIQHRAEQCSLLSVTEALTDFWTSNVSDQSDPVFTRYIAQ